MAGDEATLLYRIGLLERGMQNNEKRVDQAMEVASKHEEQINGDRGLSKAMHALTEEVKLQTQLMREIEKRRGERLWTLAGVILVALIGAAGAIIAAGVPGT